MSCAQGSAQNSVPVGVETDGVFLFMWLVLFGAVWTGTVCLQACADSVVRLLDMSPDMLA